jgi:hypothetical protein
VVEYLEKSKTSHNTNDQITDVFLKTETVILCLKTHIWGNIKTVAVEAWGREVGSLMVQSAAGIS